jgi:hypothetical protein
MTSLYNSFNSYKFNNDNINNNITPSTNNISYHISKPDKVADNFIYEYYKKVSDKGWNVITHMFVHNCKVICRNKIIGNEHDLINTMSVENVKKARYSELNYNWIVLSKNKLMINVFGKFQFILYTGISGVPVVFSETFILKHAENNNIMCYYHILNF